MASVDVAPVRLRCLLFACNGTRHNSANSMILPVSPLLRNIIILCIFTI